MPPTAEATTGFFFQSPSVTVSPNPSRRLFWMIMVEADCSALISSAAPRRQIQDVYVGVLPGRFARFSQDHRAFRVIRGPATRQHQLAIIVAFHNLISPNHAHGVLQAVEARHLGKDRAARVDLKAFQDFGDDFRFEFPVFLRQRVNRRVEKVWGMDNWRANSGEENAGIVTADERREEVPNPGFGWDRSMWQRQIQRPVFPCLESRE